MAISSRIVLAIVLIVLCLAALAVFVSLNGGPKQDTFNLTGYYGNNTMITQIVSLTSGSLVNVTFVWDTTGLPRGNYTISAYASPVSGETHTEDNNFTNGLVQVLMPGDVVSPFGKIDVRDVSFVAKRFGTNPSSPLWDPNADINGDGKVDIKDVSTAAKNFGMNY